MEKSIIVDDQKIGPSTIRVMPTSARRQAPKACHEIAWDLLVPSTSRLVSLEFIFQPTPPAIISLLFKTITTLYPLSFFCLKTTLPSHFLLLVRCSPFPPDHQIKGKVGSQRVSQIVCLRLRFCLYLHFKSSDFPAEQLWVPPTAASQGLHRKALLVTHLVGSSLLLC